MSAQYDHLLQLLEQAPVMGVFHSLLPMALPPEILTVNSAQAFSEAMDALEPTSEHPVLINEYDARFSDRFLTTHFPDLPPINILNRFLPGRMSKPLSILTHTDIATRISKDALTRGYQTVILLLVDGLSYDETREWAHEVEPCLVNGPSITFARTESDRIAGDVGFARIVGKPPLASRLHAAGLEHSRGYSYWDRAQNDVSEYLFQGVPLQRVQSISEAMKTLWKEDITGLYVQIVREGTDGIAHRRREVRPSEVKATVAAIYEDLQTLVRLLRERQVRGAVYLTSDHGMLWKQEHDFERLPAHGTDHPRYTLQPPPGSVRDKVTPVEAGNRTYFLYHYPYLGRRIRANDSGIHGGVSYQESIVPFVHLEVL